MKFGLFYEHQLPRPWEDGAEERVVRWATGVAVLVDGLATGDGNRGHDFGRAAPHLLLRLATCTARWEASTSRCRPSPRCR